MERLQSLLRSYNLSHAAMLQSYPWTRQFCGTPFPEYWRQVFSIAANLPRKISVIEIGSGFGYVTSIFAYLGFDRIIGFEQQPEVAAAANQMLNDLFGKGDVVKPQKYENRQMNADVMVLVNCAYADNCTTKEEYMQHLLDFYKQAGCPHSAILEVIDSEYTLPDIDFPEYIRLSEEDICSMFPAARIQSWKTYRFPENKKSKTLYWIENS